MKIAIVLVVCLLLAGLAGFLVYMDVFTAPIVMESTMGPYTIVYEPHLGDYRRVGKVLDQVHAQLKADGIETFKGIGIYYDNPRITPPARLRSDLGSVLEEKDLARVPELEKKKYKIQGIPAQNSIVVQLPIKNFFSYVFGPMQAYPALAQYAREKSYVAGLTYELYDVTEKKIYYVMTIAR